MFAGQLIVSFNVVLLIFPIRPFFVHFYFMRVQNRVCLLYCFVAFYTTIRFLRVLRDVRLFPVTLTSRDEQESRLTLTRIQDMQINQIHQAPRKQACKRP